MKNNLVLRWALSAVFILLIIMGGYLGYIYLAKPAINEHTVLDKSGSSSESAVDKKQNNDHHGHGDHEKNKNSGKSDILPAVHYKENIIHIELKDKMGKEVDAKELEVNHEKIMHLIIVNDELHEYYHLHPKNKGNGVFTIKHSLKEGSYKAFIDINPKDKNYEVQPSPFEVGAGDAHKEHERLKPDTEFTKTVDNYTVTMKPESFSSNEEIVLDFNLKENKAEPYLGALGHVVILDESGEKYVHVHPKSDTDTMFATKFDKPGIYKIWGEFKIDGKVHVFPYVIEIR